MATNLNMHFIYTNKNVVLSILNERNKRMEKAENIK